MQFAFDDVGLGKVIGEAFEAGWVECDLRLQQMIWDQTPEDKRDPEKAPSRDRALMQLDPITLGHAIQAVAGSIIGRLRKQAPSITTARQSDGTPTVPAALYGPDGEPIVN